MKRAFIVCIAVVTSLLAPGAAQAATISVNTTNDGVANDGNCTIREALNAARSNTAANGCTAGDADAPDTISLDASGIYQVMGTGDDTNATGDLDILSGPGTSQGVTIQGDPGPSATDTEDKIGQAGMTDRVLNAFSAPLTLDTVTVQNGSTNADIGGGVLAVNNSPVTVTDSVIRANTSTFGGGGIAAVGSLTVTDSLIGGPTAADANKGRVGGGIDTVNGTFTLTGTTVQGNVATLAADGLSTAAIIGGGVASGATNTVITDSTITGNSALAGENIDPTAVGGLDANNTNLTMTGTTVSGNTVVGGNNGNSAGVRVTSSSATTSTILNSTISGNSVDNTGMGLRSIGGLTTSNMASVTLAQSTVTGNTSPVTPTGIFSGGATTTLRGSLISQGTAGCAGPIVADAYNADAGTSCVGATDDSDLETATPLALDPISPLNGGPTATHALGATSVAIDAVPSASCTGPDGTTPLLVDQRGAERPAGSACDAGAYERVTCGGFLPAGNLLGGPGDDTLIATLPGGLDTIVGSGGNDTIDGISGNDALCGGSGNDSITGGAGQDQIFGDAGDDTVLAKDGVADTIDCGPGNDTATFDAGLDTVTACEIDTDNPPIGGGGGGGGGAIIPPPVKKCKKPKKKTKKAKKKFKKCKKRLRKAAASA